MYNTYVFELTHKSRNKSTQAIYSQKQETAQKSIKQMFQKQQGYVNHKLIEKG